MKKIVLIFLFLPLLLGAQPVQPITSADFPDAVVSRPDHYNTESIWDYMNSGADLFLEFGFTSLMVQELAWPDARIKLEIWQMNSPEAAYGIYSLSLIKCPVRDTLCGFDCLSAFGYQAAWGDLYLTLTGEEGTGNDLRPFLPAVQTLMKKNPRTAFTLPEPFNDPIIRQGRRNLTFINGPVGLQNGMFPYQDLFTGVRFGMFATLLTRSDLDVYFSRIAFLTPGDMLLFLGYAGLMKDNMPIPNTNTNDGLYREYKPLDALTIYFLQSQEPYPIDGLFTDRH